MEEQIAQQQQLNATTESADQATPAKSARLQSLDALRGFDMFWIIGGDSLVRHIAECVDRPWLNGLSDQMSHVAWEGFRFMDLVFPLFLFIAGTAIPFSLASYQKRGLTRKQIYFRISRRLVILVVLGVIYNGGLAFAGMEKTRFASVLGLIGIGYFFAFLIVMHFQKRGQLIFCGGILLAYWAALSWIPVPEFGAGQLTGEGSLASYIDRLFMPGRLYGGQYDPEGILQSLSGISLALIGAMAGQWLARQDRQKWTKALGLLIAGVVLVAAGLIWGQFYPVIKKLWTGSFILLAAGWSLLLLSVFYCVIDCIGLKKWAIVFTVIGMNPITIYLADRLIDFKHMNDFLFGGLINLAAEPYRLILYCVGLLLLKWLMLYFLYRKKVFLKI